MVTCEFQPTKLDIYRFWVGNQSGIASTNRPIVGLLTIYCV